MVYTHSSSHARSSSVRMRLYIRLPFTSCTFSCSSHWRSACGKRNGGPLHSGSSAASPTLLSPWECAGPRLIDHDEATDAVVESCEAFGGRGGRLDGPIELNENHLPVCAYAYAYLGVYLPCSSGSCGSGSSAAASAAAVMWLLVPGIIHLATASRLACAEHVWTTCATRIS